MIRSCVKLAYEHAQGFIDHPDRTWTPAELPPISKGYSVGDIVTRVLNLNKVGFSFNNTVVSIKLMKGN